MNKTANKKKETRLEKWRRLDAGFKFDFNEETDPVKELGRLRRARRKHFKTAEAEGEYIRLTPSAKMLLRELKRGIQLKAEQEWANLKADRKPTARKRAAK